MVLAIQLSQFRFTEIFILLIYVDHGHFRFPGSTTISSSGELGCWAVTTVKQTPRKGHNVPPKLDLNLLKVSGKYVYDICHLDKKTEYSTGQETYF